MDDTPLIIRGALLHDTVEGADMSHRMARKLLVSNPNIEIAMPQTHSQPTARFPALLFSAFLMLCGLAASVQAQDIKDMFLDAQVFKPIKLETEIKTSMGAFTTISNTTFKPPGDGPFPAIVLLHSCGGIQHAHMRQHGQELLKEGYVVLMLDSFTPRGRQNCAGGPLNGRAGIVDSYAALEFLASQPFVDKARIYQAGYSWGALVSVWLGSPQSAAVAGSSLRFRATVSNYGTCVFSSKYVFLLKDSDKPLLMLLGGRDAELPMAPCFPMLDQYKATGVPVQWQVYPTATHSWDKQGMVSSGYIYDEAITKDATARMLAFFSENR